jgi:hypothetical protein
MRARLKPWLAAGLLSLVSAAVHARAPRANHSSCLRATVAATLDGGQSFRQPLGNGLALRLDPLPDDQGWQAAVSPAGSDEDWAYPVNPPLRFGNAENLATGYGRSVREELSHTHEIRFPLTRKDYLRMFDLASQALWPYQSKQRPETITQAYFDALDAVTTGVVIVSPIDFEKAGPPERTRWMKFSAVIVVPRAFRAEPGLHWAPGSCSPDDLSGSQTPRAK